MHIYQTTHQLFYNFIWIVLHIHVFWPEPLSALNYTIQLWHNDDKWCAGSGMLLVEHFTPTDCSLRRLLLRRLAGLHQNVLLIHDFRHYLSICNVIHLKLYNFLQLIVNGPNLEGGYVASNMCKLGIKKSRLYLKFCQK